MEGVSNHYIDSVLKPICANYCGVFSANNIPISLRKKKVFSIVCNLSNEGQAGSHFVTILSFPNYVIYIDSLGLPCIIEPISNFLSRLNKPVFYNTTQIQSAKSKFCGFYCILFVLLYDRKPNIKLSFTRKNLMLNDERCVEYITQILK